MVVVPVRQEPLTHESHEVVGDQSSSNHVVTTIDGSGADRDLQQGRQLFELADSQLGVEETALKSSLSTLLLNTQLDPTKGF